jgi:hypothetical protein
MVLACQTWKQPVRPTASNAFLRLLITPHKHSLTCGEKVKNGAGTPYSLSAIQPNLQLVSYSMCFGDV